MCGISGGNAVHGSAAQTTAFQNPNGGNGAAAGGADGILQRTGVLVGLQAVFAGILFAFLGNWLAGKVMARFPGKKGKFEA